MSSGVDALVADAAILNVRCGSLAQKYDVGDEIGSGSYGRALVAIRHEDGEKVVIKEIRLSDMDEKQQQEALSECKVLSQFEHVNIVRYYEAVLEDGCLNIVMEYASCGDLSEAVMKRQEQKKPFQEDEIMFWFVQIVLALFHVHSKSILHRDLKSQNIFIADGNILKLGDFGISRVLTSDTELARTVVGTPYYLSPEICEDRPYNRKSDVWALGCVLYEMATLKRAFDGMSLPALIVRILKGKYPPVPTRYSSPLRSLIDSMLKQNPKDRPSVDAILRLEYVRNHVARYAQHVMALTPIEPGALGVDVPARSQSEPSIGAEGQRRGANSDRKPAVPSRPKPARPADNSRGPSQQILDNPQSPGSSSDAIDGSSPVRSPPVAGRRAAAPSPSKAAPPTQSTWMRQQQSALNELEGAFSGQSYSSASPLNAQPPIPRRISTGTSQGRHPHPNGPQHHAPITSQHSAGTLSIQSGLDATALSSHEYKQRLDQRRVAELEANKVAVQNVKQERERARIAAEERSREQGVAVRSRVEERRREAERNLLEQKAESEAKAAKAVELQRGLRAKEDVKNKLQMDLEAHMAAHREQIKAAKARVNREELLKLGAQFEMRALKSTATDSHTTPQVMVVFPNSASPATPSRGMRGGAPGTPRTSGPKGTPPPMRPPSRGGGPVPPPKSKPNGASPAPSKQPPWKQNQQRNKGLNPAGGFPDVEIFTPFGSELDGRSPPLARPITPLAQPITPMRVSGGVSGCKVPPSPRVSTQRLPGGGGPQSKAAAVWGNRNGNNLLSVLSQIQDVLSEDQPEPPPPGAPKRRSSSGFTPPSIGHGGSRPASALRRTSGSNQQVCSKLVLPPEPDDDLVIRGVEKATTSRPSSANQANRGPSNAQKVEALRANLEKELGAHTFQAAYHYLREIQRCEDDDDEDGTNTPDKESVKTLESILGARIPLSRQIHKLMVLEDHVFS